MTLTFLWQCCGLGIFNELINHIYSCPCLFWKHQLSAGSWVSFHSSSMSYFWLGNLDSSSLFHERDKEWRKKNHFLKCFMHLRKWYRKWKSNLETEGRPKAGGLLTDGHSRVAQKSAFRRPPTWLMLSCHHLEVPIKCRRVGSAFVFCTKPHKLCFHPWPVGLFLKFLFVDLEGQEEAQEKNWLPKIQDSIMLILCLNLMGTCPD